MGDTSTSEVVREVMSLVLGVSPESDTTKRSDLPQWDSLKHVELVFALEDACGVEFGPDELTSLDSLDAIVSHVERHKK